MTGYGGCGLELAKILFQRNSTIYLAGRNEEKGLTAVKAVRTQFPQSQGQIEFLKVDLADLSSIKPAVDLFLSKSNRLHGLTNNAGVMTPPAGSKTTQVSDLTSRPKSCSSFFYSINTLYRATNFRWERTALDHSYSQNCFYQLFNVQQHPRLRVLSALLGLPPSLQMPSLLKGE